MKKLIFLLLIAASLCSAGCSKKSSDSESVNRLPATESQSEETTQSSTEDYNTLVNATLVPPYDPKDHPVNKERTIENAMVHDGYPRNTKQLLDALGENGLIATGTAYGQREGFFKNDSVFHTDTKVKIDKVITGNAKPGDSITVREDYVLLNDETGEFYYSLLGRYSHLINGDYVLLFLTPSKNPELDVYFPTVYAMPIEEDCEEWDEEYLESFLDYFRGDTSTYKIPENLVYTVNGYPVIQTPPGWPQRDISNEDLIEEMKENVLFYIATELKLKIWPTEHVNYVGNHGGSASDSMYYWQYPGKAQR